VTVFFHPPIPKAFISKIKPYVGGLSHIQGAKNPLKLSSNENTLGPSPKAIEACRAVCSKKLARYPDGAHTVLKKAIASVHNLPLQQIICGAGSDQLFTLLAQAYLNQGDEAIYTEYGFLMYRIVTLAAGGTPICVPEKNLKACPDTILSAVTERTRIVFLANPNNPTGTFLNTAELGYIARNLPEQTIFVIDSAYAEYAYDGNSGHSNAEDYSDGHALVDEFSNVLVTRTLSKIYGLAGLRIGWGHASVQILDAMERVREPFNLSTPALYAGEAALYDQDYIQSCVADNVRNRQWVLENLQGMNVECVPSRANFLLIKPKTPDIKGKNSAAAVAEALRSQNIIVRELCEYSLPDYLRVTIGSQEECQKFIDALSNIY
jgi:histidinol-phosphate aminotransferase